MNGGLLSSMFFKPNLTSPTLQSIQCIRNASKKAGGACKNPEAAKPKNRGVKIMDGQRVLEGRVLVTQHSLKFHPGLNVMGERNALVAVKRGVVKYTTEKTNLDWENPLVQKFHVNREGQDFYKIYVHVIPEPDHYRFKLVSLV